VYIVVTITFKDKTIAITGASGTLGQALLQVLHHQGAHLIALTSRPDPIPLEDIPEGAIETIPWHIGAEDALKPLWERVDILILNHGVNVYGDRSPEALHTAYEVNTFSHWRILNHFLEVPGTTPREVWINTSEAEVNPAFSPLYELSKRTLGDWITLRRLDAPCPLRKLILGPFRSALNPVGIMDAHRVAARIVDLAQRDTPNIIVTINPLTHVLFPLREWSVSQYFRWFTAAPTVI
jgi:hypothetical protein